ncbi:MAG: cyd operon YbgE family protein [Chromatiales bacterium]|nr:cyd operon YbgE family protein [Chromatiales bacterium]
MTIPYPAGIVGRGVSFLLAVALTVLILVYPRAIATGIDEIRHGLLSLLMWGIAAGFVHGVGFVPRLTPWRLVFHPIVGWTLMIGGIMLLLSA